MPEISRQQKLASAKKKLKKFQQTKTPSPAQETTNLSQDILQGLQTSNHIFKTPSLNSSKNQSLNSSPTQSPYHTTNVPQKLNFSSNTPLIETTTSAIDFFGGPSNGHSSPSKNADQSELMNKSQGVAGEVQTSKSNETSQSTVEEMVASYKRSNQQLSSQVGEQRKQIIQLQEKLKEQSAAVQKLVDQKALKEQLEVHIQTIGILVSEKSELQSSIANIQKKVSAKDAEINDLTNQHKTAQTNLLEYEKNINELKQVEGTLNKTNKELVIERDRISTKLYEVSHQKEELNLQNSELQNKLQMKIGECDTVMQQLNELKLRFQSGEQPQEVNSMNWKQEKEQLAQLLDEQKAIVQKLVNDRAELQEKNHDTQSHFENQIEELLTRLKVNENEKNSVLENSKFLSQTVEDLQQQLESLRQKPVQESTKLPESSIDSSINVIDSTEIESIKSQKESLERELDLQISENRRLSKLNLEQTDRIEALETSIGRFQSESMDRSSLLDQIQSDKETLSRALQQNKKLKEQLVELEEGFVRMSNSSADLTTKLETEQHGSKDMALKFSELKVELEEAKTKLLERTRDFDKVSEELQSFKEELHSTQMKLATKEMDVDLLSTELETNQRQATYNQKIQQNTISGNILAERLQEQLQSAEATIGHLNTQNDQLQTALRHLSMKKQETEDVYEQIQTSTTESSHETQPENDQDNPSMEYADDDDMTTESSGDIITERDAIHVSRIELSKLQQRLVDLQTERERILSVLQEEREKSFNATERLEEHVELKVQQLTIQRERELQEHFYEQTEALQRKVQSLQKALEIMRKNEDIADFDMTSDGITMPLLKTAFMQLQKRYKSAMDSKANLSDRIEQLEHMNMRLESETETIGEYIALYQTQRQAMKDKFVEKDEIINRISKEHGRMQSKVSQLHQLVMQMLSERSGYESKNKQLQELVNRRLAQQSGEGHEAEVPKLDYNLDNLFGEITLTPEDETELMKDTFSVNGDDVRRDSVTDQTTQQILNIFEQLETTGEGYQYGWLSPAARKHSFLPCKNCTGELLSL